YTLDNNDMKFGTPQGFSTGDEWLAYVRDAFDVLYAEGAEYPRMMSVGLHMRLMGRPGRIAALVRFLDHVERHDRVWICRRVDIARHWIARHPYQRWPSSEPGERAARAFNGRADAPGACRRESPPGVSADRARP